MTEFNSPHPDMERITLITKPSAGYELLDSGGGGKLERFGTVVLARPDPQALWPKHLPEGGWQNASGVYVKESGEGNKREGKWTGKLEKEWHVEFGGLKFLIRPTSFKHTGLFPEQLSNWEWMRDILHKSLVQRRDERDPNSSAKTFVPNVLNLFAYTGGATLAAVAAGAEVTHVDASKTAVAWAKENAIASGLADKPIRWIVEDVLVFVNREIKRGTKYDAIIMDPPAFGHGPKNEIWKIEENLPELVELCTQLLSDKPLFVLINGYAEGYSPLAFAYNLEKFEKKFGGSIECGDLTIEEKAHSTSSGQGSGRLLPAGIFARWKSI